MHSLCSTKCFTVFFNILFTFEEANIVRTGANCDTEAETKMDLINCQLCGCKMQ